MRLTFAFASLLVVAVACDGKSLTSSQTDALPARVPLNHRASGAACPAQRAPGSTASPVCGTDGGLTLAALGVVGCTSDGDCTAGSNGRCNAVGGPIAVCGATCSYDACFTDRDCPDNQACDCRATSASLANSCLTGGNCRVDSDCGEGGAGYCSPSQIDSFCFCPSTALCGDSGASCYAGDQQVSCSCGDSCGHSYFCHTKKDSCIDDSDCASGQSCNYDTVNGIWDCATCWPVI